MDMDGEDFNSKPPKTYALSGKIMLSSIVILFAVVVIMICLHIYARWYLLRARRRHNFRRRTQRRTQMVFYVEPDNPAAARGLDAAALRSLPVFMYSSKTHPGALECAVCLSAFEEGEKVRLLPNCNHSFHIECIDMWFHSHSTCPLCRSAVPGNLSDVIISVGESEPVSSSGFCATCQEEGNSSMAPSSSLGDRRKAAVTIEVPSRNESGDDLRPSSPAIQSKSPASRLQTLKRILSMNIKGAGVSPSSGIGPSCGSAATQFDVERGKDESTQQETRI